MVIRELTITEGGKRRFLSQSLFPIPTIQSFVQAVEKVLQIQTTFVISGAEQERA